MAIIKRAIAVLTDIEEMVDAMAAANAAGLMIKTAGRISVSDSEIRRVIDAEIKKHPTALFFRARAIVADEMNSNGDYFSSDELIKAAGTFVGVPFYTNHENQDINKAKGKIVFSEWAPKDKAIYVIGFIDREAYPQLCRGVQQEYMTGVSMGAINSEALVTMHDGIDKPIKDVLAGEFVLSPFGRKCRVVKTHSATLGKQMYRLSIESYHKSPLFTEDHPIMVIRRDDVSAAKRRCVRTASKNKYERRMGRTVDVIGWGGWRNSNYSPSFVEAADVGVGDYVVVPSRFYLQDDGTNKLDNFFYVSGAYLGDGYAANAKTGELERLTFCLGLGEKEINQRIATLVEEISDKKAVWVPVEARNGLYLSIYDRDLGNKIVGMFGRGAKNKRVGCRVMSVSQAKSLLCGYLDTDGCVVRRSKDGGFGGFQIGSVNRALLEDCQSLLVALGIPSRITTVDRTPSKNSIVRIPTTEHTLAIGANGLKVFEWSSKVQKSGVTMPSFGGGNTFTFKVGDTMAMACRILDKDIVLFDGRVCDLTVEGDESYIAEGMAVHNCVVENSECSICGNVAATVEEYCPHIKFRKGRTFSGTVKHVRTGEIRNLKNALCYEFNRGVRFIELSGVGDPACKSCRIQGVLDNDEHLSKAASAQRSVGHGGYFMAKVASIENSVYMYKDTDLYKQAGQQELQQLEQVLGTLEQISVGLIKNRKRVEVEFASDLVKILSELQEFTDELTGAGYGQLEGSAGGIPGVEGTDAGIPPPAEGVPNASGATGAAMPISDIVGGDLGAMPMAAPAGGAGGTGAGGVGQVSGSPTKPVVSTPRMPTAPKKPMASSEDRMRKVSELLSAIKVALVDAGVMGKTAEENEEVEEMNRRTPVVASMERESIQKTLSASMKGKGGSLENGNNYGKSVTSGGVQMSQSKIVTADRTEAPGVLPEKQLDADLKNHPRTGVEQNSIQQVQLEGERTGAEAQTLTEDQIKGEHKDNAPGVLPEKQLAGLRKENEPNSTQQVQLEPNRTGTEPQVTHEKQLEDKPNGLWSRSAMNRKTTKTAYDHTQAVMRVLAESAIRCSATPQQIREAAATLVDGMQARTETLDQITSPQTEQDAKYRGGLDVAARAKYWGGKGVTLASTTKHDVAKAIVSGLKILIASDVEIGPEMVMDVMDVVSSEDQATEAISGVIDTVLATPQEEKAAASNSRKEILAAIRGGHNVEKLASPPAPLVERKPLSQLAAKKVAAPAKKPTHVVEATLKEIGTSIEEIKNDKAAAKKKISAFVKRLSSMKDLTVESMQADKEGKKMLVASKVPQLKVANITNVTVDSKDGTVQIAIQTEEGDMKADLELPMGDQGGVEGAPVEGDATGEGLDSLIGGGAETPPPPAAGAQTPPAAPAPGAPLPTASTKGKTVKTAQLGGGTGGGLPGGGPMGGAPDQAAGPAGMPAMDDGGGLQSFTDDEKKDDDKAPGVGEQMMPGSICPFCHGTDTTTGKKDLPAGAFECNGCGAVYEVHVNIEMLNPENAKFEKGNGDEGNITEPDLPEMPVAASIKLDKDSIVKIASCESKYGHVCPACGMTECKPLEKEASRVVYVCPSCHTKTSKDVYVDMKDKSSTMQVEWVISPNKVATAGCKDCKKAALEYVARVKVTKMMRKAADANGDPKTAFPMANCVEYVGRRWGANAVATNGSCKGTPLAECACKQLAAFGMRTRRDVEKLAAVYTRPDEMAECLKLHIQKGYKQAQAKPICEAMRAKYAKESDDNEWLEAFASDSRFTTEELRIMKQKASEIITRSAQAGMPPADLDMDLGAPIDDVGGEGDMVTVEIPKEVAADLAAQIDTQSVEAPVETPIDGAVPPEAPVTAAGKAATKVAAKPNKVEDISSGVEGKVKGGTGTIGNEGPDNIDVAAKKPVIPSNPEGSKIRGEKQTIPEAIVPDIAKDNSLMGDEANTQKGMPAINLDTRGRVIAGTKEITKEAAKPNQVEDISVGVDGKVKGGKGTIGNEGKDNIDVSAKAPVIPSNPSGAKIDGEKQTIPEAGLPEIPVDNSLIEGEKTTKGIGTDTPPISHDIRGRVIADAKRNQQVERIAAARHKKASQVAGKLMGMGRIAEADYDAVVEDLAKIEVDRIEAFAERMFRAVKTASTHPQVTLSTPIVQEASAYKPELPKSPFDELKGMFTIGTPQLSRAIEEEDKAARG